MKNMLYPIKRLNIESRLKWWLLQKYRKESEISLSEILEGEYFHLLNTVNREFNLFEIYGNSKQDGTPALENPVEIKSCGDSGTITEKIINKNLLDNSKIIQGDINDSNGAIYHLGSSQHICTEEFIRVQPNTEYSYSVSSKQRYIKIFEYDENKNYFDIMNGSYNSDNKTITTSAKTKYVRCGVFNNNGVLKDNINLQLEQNSIRTEIINHQEQIYTIPCQKPMRAVEEVVSTNLIKDEFVKQNGKWFEKHNIKKYVFTGNENWTVHTTTENFVRFFTNGVDFSDYQNSKGLCNNFFYNGTPGGLSVPNAFRFAVYSIAMRFWVCLPIEYNITTVNLLKAKIKELYDNGNPMYVLYYTNTPELIECTEEQSTVLESISKAKTYKGETNIMSTDEVPPILKIQYYERKN